MAAITICILEPQKIKSDTVSTVSSSISHEVMGPVGDGQGGLACYESWGCKELDTTGRLNNKNIRSLLEYLVHVTVSILLK